MAQSLSKLYIHIIFHIKDSSCRIRNQEKEELFSYIGQIIKTNESIPIQINGTDDHIHILCIMSKNIALSKLTEEIKRNSSRWIKTKDKIYQNFRWQGGYAGFSVGSSLIERTIHYIINQEKHHQKKSFKEEYKMFLEEYGIDYNEQYLWND